MSGVAFGPFDWVHHRQVPVEQLYEEGLEVLQAADAAALSGYDVAEHHTAPLAHEQVARLLDTTEVDYAVGCFAWGDLTLAQSLRSLRRFATEVMPSFSDQGERAAETERRP